MSAINVGVFAAAPGVNTLSVTINPGDFVVLIATTQNSSYISGLADNGSGGGNAYTLLNQNSNSGYTACYYCLYATKSATQISFTSTSSEVIIVGTYKNSLGFPVRLGTTTNSGNSGSGGSSISSGAITTTQPNSRLVTLMVWWNSSAGVSVTASSGTLQKTQQPSVVSGVVCGMAIVDQLTTTVGAYTNSVNTSGGNAQYQGTWTLELIPISPMSYLGVVPPKAKISAIVRAIPTLIGGGGVGTPATPVPVASLLKGGTVGVSYSETISAQGGTGTGYVYSIVSGAIPTSLSLNSSTGIISGTPTAAGTYSFTIKVTDSLGNTGTQAFQIIIAAPSYTLEEYGQVLHDAVVGTAYSETLSVTGGTGPYTWSLASGSLPTGLSLSSSGVISGTPSAAGTFTFAVTVTDASSVTQTITFTIAAATPAASGGGSWVF